jgi:hypothetical protein
MHPAIKTLARTSLKRFDLRIEKASYVQRLETNTKAGNVMEMLQEYPDVYDAQRAQENRLSIDRHGRQ